MRDGKAVFKYIKYRNPIDRPGGVKGGGLLVMQAELALPPKDEAEIRRRIEERLRKENIPVSQAASARIGRPLITRGKVTVAVMGEGGNALVQKVIVPSPPSLFGNNAVSIGIELNEFGAPVFEAALKSQGAGLVIVGYELGYSAKLPMAHIRGTWNASSFASFTQEINEDWNYWGEDDYEEKISGHAAQERHADHRVASAASARRDGCGGTAEDDRQHRGFRAPPVGRGHQAQCAGGDSA